MINDDNIWKHFTIITLLNIYVLDIFYYRINSYADSYAYSRIIIWAILAIIEQIILWKSDFYLTNGERFVWFCAKILNPIVWFAVCWIFGM